MAEKKEKIIYISGHRNPDTDSICSAMALADLKNKISARQVADEHADRVVYKAVRAGHLNQETRYVMKAFDVTAPTYMRDARTQIKDIFDDKTQSVSGNISLRQAWKTMRAVKKATLAITDSKGHLEGLISTGDIAKSYMAVFDNCILAQAHTPYVNIIDTVEGELLAGDAKQCVTSGKVVISTANTEIIKDHIDAGDVVILGNRYEAQLCALEQHASVIIVCDGAPVSRTIRKIAGDNGCAVISTAYDTYAVARLINQSLPVSYFMTKENLVVFKENSYVDDIKDIMMKERIRDFPVVTEDDCYAGMISRRNLIDMNKKKFILVDHNEADQAINGIEETEIVEIIDHHKLGTIETIIGDTVIPSANTTPESLLVQKYFRQMLDEGCDCAVMEVSSQGLMLHRTAGFQFEIGIFTNIEPDHIGPNEHTSFEHYLECKKMLLRQCKIGIVNRDDEHFEKIVDGHTCILETYGFSQEANLRAVNPKLVTGKGTLGISYQLDGLLHFPVEIDLPGKFSIYNSLTAIAICRHFNVSEENIRKALKVAKVKGRIEMVKVSDEFTLMIDYAHNAMSLESLLTTLKEYHPHRLVCLFGCGGNRSRDRRFEMGEVSGRLADLTIITSDNPRNEEPQAIIDDIKTGISKTEGKYVEIIDRKEAIAYAITHARPGDMIVMLGKGHEDYIETEGVKRHFSEHEAIMEIMQEIRDGKRRMSAG